MTLKKNMVQSLKHFFSYTVPFHMISGNTKLFLQFNSFLNIHYESNITLKKDKHRTMDHDQILFIYHFIISGYI